MDTLRFEWDPNKNEINKKKHGLSFEAAKEVFYDEFAILFDDPDHSIEEDRFLIIGSIKSQKICIVSHCYRDNENCIRIISARQAAKTEQRIYLGGDSMRDEYNISELNPRKKSLHEPAEKADYHQYRRRHHRLLQVSGRRQRHPLSDPD